ncbi:MAG: MopE-related protein [Pseudomonadota bacterium]|nr:MopE-related protein [Pseudomonadota bacterium]
MRLSTLFLAALVGLLPGCDDAGKETGDTEDTGPGVNLDDVDGDGIGTDEDCDDADAAVGGPTTEWLDADADGYGDGDNAVETCTPGVGSVTNADDCDDAAAAVNPGAAEVCNGVDDNCDAVIDEGASGGGTWYTDADLDGYGDAATGVQACEAPAGTVADATDCDDADAAVNPAAAEVCDGAVDEDCDGLVDDADDSTTGAATWYTDVDGDGFGDPATAVDTCTAPSLGVTDGTDCDDTRATVSPGGVEVCDSLDLDEDCDGAADDADPSLSDAATWYVDADGDTFGTEGSSLAACDQPDGYAALAGDCDDADVAYRPDADESDCADPNDYNCDGSVGYADGDGDGYAACEDCDDAAATTFPGADEYCDGADNDCDGSLDEADALDAGAWYADVDADGYGDAAMGLAACDAPEGYGADATDCDDTASVVNPGATEVCDAADVDEDCDALVDDADAGVIGQALSYVDADGDGFGDDADPGVASCDLPAGSAALAEDCDDAVAAINPGATELCDADDVDEDCDGLADDADLAADGGTLWYVDLDGDGFGDAADTGLAACDLPAGYVADNTDCDDTAASAYPGAPETCNGDDDDCDGTVDEADATDAAVWYADADLDGYGDAGTPTSACAQPSGYVADATDCDDALGAVNPAAAETCNTIDDNCDGTTDGDDATDVTTWYADADGDTYGDPTATDLACYEPDGFVADDQDCDDTAAAVNPMGTETCNGEDDDCDGSVDDGATDFVTWYQDLDGDLYGNPGVSALECEAPAQYVALDGDCDDATLAVNPGATEVCDAADVDEDCDALADDADPSVTGASTWYSDADSDGYGIADPTTMSCDQPVGYAADVGDCDDGASATNPGAEEVCGDGVDNDCFEGTTCRDWSGGEALADASGTYTGTSIGAVSTTTTGSLGGGLAGGKDINGDGYADVLLADRLYDFGTTPTANTGRTYLLTGSATGLTATLASALATFTVSTGTNSGDRSGQGVAMLDDVDADGADELIIGAYAANYGFTDAGEVCLFKGGSEIEGNYTASSAYITLSGVAANAFAGGQIEQVGDVDDDGIADWAVSSGGSTAVSGTVLSGATPSGTYVTGSTALLANITSAGAGAGFADDIDLTGDGVPDIVGLAYSTTGAFVFAGGAGFGGSMTSADADFSITGMGALIAHSNTTSVYTHSIANAGDNNGDGYEDLIIGADGYDETASDVGRAYLYLGPISSSITALDAVATVTGSGATDMVGKSVSGRGDIDGDGFDDVIVGAPNHDLGGATTVNAGAAALLYGPTVGDLSLTTADASWFGAASNLLGASGRIVGDVDADGYDDFMLGAPGTSNESLATVGAAYLFYGSGE